MGSRRGTQVLWGVRSLSKPLPLPWASTSDERRAIIAYARAIVGGEIEIVRYGELTHVRESDFVHAEAFDVVTMGIEFDMSDGKRIAATWVLGGYPDGSVIVGDTNGLSFGPGSIQDRFGLMDIQLRDVTASHGWASRARKLISDVECTFDDAIYRHEQVESLWSIRIDFDSAPSVVIALGGPTVRESGHLQHEPKCVAAIFDERAARSFRIPHSRRSSWGR